VAAAHQDTDHVKASGCRLGVEKYFCINTDARTINLKKVGALADIKRIISYLTVSDSMVRFRVEMGLSL
jgi:hypothetical protein